MADLPEVSGTPSGDIEFEDIRGGTFTDDAALNLVVRDAERTESWLAQQQWSLLWKECDTLYQSPRFLSAWEGSPNMTRSNVVRFTVAKHVNSVVPTLVNGIFYDDPPFILRPRPGTSQETIRAKTALFSYQLEDMNFYQAVKAGFRSAALFGTAIWKWGWVTDSKKVRQYVRKRTAQTVEMPLTGDEQIHTEESDEFEVREVDQRVDRPFFDNVDIRHIMVDPGCREPDIRRARFVIHRQYQSFKDLDALRGQEGYDIPSEAQLKAIFDPKSGEVAVTPGTNEQIGALTGNVHHAMPRNLDSTLDPTEQGLEVLERWDNDKVITVLQRKWVIRNEPNPFGVIPFYSSNWWDIPDAFWGMGIGRIIGQDQRAEMGLTNAALDILALAVNPQYARSKGANIPTQQIRARLGGIIDVEGNPKEALTLVDTPKVPAEVWAAIQVSESQAESATGANDNLVQGSASAPKTSMGRTATGAGNMMSAVAGRLQDPVENFIFNVYEPWIVQMDELNNERLPMSALREVLGDELGPEYKLDEHNFLNARIKFEVLAGSHLVAKKTMAQALPLLVQLFSAPQMLQQLNQTGWTVDLKELMRMMMEVSEWKNQHDIIRKLTPEEKQAQAANNPAQQQIAAKAGLEDQKFQHTQAIVDQENLARAAREVMRQTIEKSESPEAVTGEAGGTGFGSQV